MDKIGPPQFSTAETRGLKVAWCCRATNLTSVYNLTTQTEYPSFQGAAITHDKLREIFRWASKLSHIPGTDHLLSLNFKQHHNGIFGVYNATTQKPIFKYPIITGDVGTGDVAINFKRNLAAVLPIWRKAAFHLYDCGENKMIRKSKWPYGPKEPIEGLDFNPEGTIAITMDAASALTAIEVDTNKELFSTRLAGLNREYGRCRWNPIIGSALIATTPYEDSLRVFDATKQREILAVAIKFKNGGNRCIEWDSSGNLLAISGFDTRLRIYDHRIGSARKKMYLHSKHSAINCVTWSADSKLLGTAGSDSKIKVVDFGTGKVLYNARTANLKQAGSICFMDK